MNQKTSRPLSIILLYATVLVAAAVGCRTLLPSSSPLPTETSVPTAVPTMPPLSTPTEQLPDPTPTAQQPDQQTDQQNQANEPHAWPTAMPPEAPMVQTPATAEEWETFYRLENNHFTQKDPVTLAVTIQGRMLPVDTSTPARDIPEEGSIQTFWVHNTGNNTWSQIDARLLYVSAHAYFWFDIRREIDRAVVVHAAEAFEAFYPIIRSYYGEEPSPGIDGDPRMYVLHAAATALCDVTESSLQACGLLGYFSAADSLPAEINPYSNEHELFVINIDKQVGSDRYVSTLAHEFRHMIDFSYNQQTDDWESEGTATHAQQLAGDILGPRLRAGVYLSYPDVQMNAWEQNNPDLHYGKGYVLSEYILGRFGVDFYRAWNQSPGRALLRLDAVLATAQQPITGLDLWHDFTTAAALIGVELPLPPYIFPDSFQPQPPAYQMLQETGKTVDIVQQFGFDLYRIQGTTPTEVIFTGSTKTPTAADILPASGAFMWWSGRANGSVMSLTRELDLTQVDHATLHYTTNYRIEAGYDFGYLLVSRDQGASWNGLAAPAMLDKNPEDDPGDAALTEHFYTDETGQWVAEQVDLTPYTGGKILIRFLYVTDPVLTNDGLFLDNIAVPEIGFFDDGETGDAGWQADGFVRSTGYIPQRFHLRLITFTSAGSPPSVQILPLTGNNTVQFSLPFTEQNSEALLVITATNPLILSPANYEIEVIQ